MRSRYDDDMPLIAQVILWSLVIALSLALVVMLVSLTVLMIHGVWTVVT